MTGVFGPELVAFTAWRQWCSARLLTKIVKGSSVQLEDTARADRLRKTDDIAHSRPLNKWTMIHSLYALMGGFALEIESEEAQHFLPEECPKRLTITARGLALLIKYGIIPDIREPDTQDKSKANSRLAAALPVTPLEINTIAHVLCTFLVYLLWWNKPLSPNEPVILTGEWTNSFCAFMFMCSEISGQVNGEKVQAETMVKSMFASAELYEKRPEIEQLRFFNNFARQTEEAPQTNQVHQTFASGTTARDQNEPNASLTIARETAALSQGSFTIASKPSLDSLRKQKPQKASGTAFFERRPKLVNGDIIFSDNISTVTANRWSLASQAISRFSDIFDHHPRLSHSPKDDTPTVPDYVHFLPDTLLVHSVQNWPMSDLLRSIDGLLVGMVLWLASFVYGALHAAAWNDHFPSDAEKWLWRGSAVYISFCGGLWIVLNYVTRKCARLDAYWDRWADGQEGWYHYILRGPLVVVCGASFMLARAYIVVESVRSLPAEAYQTPQWSQIFPHF